MWPRTKHVKFWPLKQHLQCVQVDTNFCDGIYQLELPFPLLLEHLVPFGDVGYTMLYSSAIKLQDPVVCDLVARKC